MSFMTADGRLRSKHERLLQRGERPPYLIESYTALRHLEQEANSLSALGYRIQSRQDVKGTSGYYYHVTFAYVPEADLSPAVSNSTGSTHATSARLSPETAMPKPRRWRRRILIGLGVIVLVFIGLIILPPVHPISHHSGLGALGGSVAATLTAM